MSSILLLGILLGACGSVSQSVDDLGSGVASYDALKSATATCQAQGGDVRLKSGFDGRDLAGYQCVTGKAR